jgi:hypothetical protein
LSYLWDSGPQIDELFELSHCIVFWGVHVWTSTMVILEHYFPIFLHNMVDYNTKNSIAKIFFFSNLYRAIPKYICGKKKCTSLCPKKYKYTQKLTKMTFSFYEICNIHQTLYFPSGLPLWKLESQWTLEFSKNNFRNQNSLDWELSIPLKSPWNADV